MVEAVEQTQLDSPTARRSTPNERRLHAEWCMLQQMAALNPTRLLAPAAEDTQFRVTLTATPAPAAKWPAVIDSRHSLRLEFAHDFPAVPLELYLERPVFHPNVHPETGFVCLWDEHRAANNTEHALHKLAAMLGWKLFTLAPAHVMQPAAAALPALKRAQLAERLAAPVLTGIDHSGFALPAKQPAERRRRLSCW